MLLRKLAIEVEAEETEEIVNIGSSALGLLLSLGDRKEIAECVARGGMFLLVETAEGVALNRVVLANGERVKLCFSYICDISVNVKVGMKIKLDKVNAKVIGVSLEEKEIFNAIDKVIYIKTVSPIALFNSIPETQELFEKYVKLGIIAEEEVARSWISMHNVHCRYNGKFYELTGLMKINIPVGIPREIVEALGLGKLTSVGYGCIKLVPKI